MPNKIFRLLELYIVLVHAYAQLHWPDSSGRFDLWLHSTDCLRGAGEGGG